MRPSTLWLSLAVVCAACASGTGGPTGMGGTGGQEPTDAPTTDVSTADVSTADVSTADSRAADSATTDAAATDGQPSAGPCRGSADCNGGTCCAAGNASRMCVGSPAQCTGLIYCRLPKDCPEMDHCCPQGFCGGCD